MAVGGASRRGGGLSSAGHTVAARTEIHLLFLHDYTTLGTGRRDAVPRGVKVENCAHSIPSITHINKLLNK